jgi:hypothetical protein
MGILFVTELLNNRIPQRNKATFKLEESIKHRFLKSEYIISIT